MTVRVKICGITSYDDAAMCIDEGAHALGFNFFPPSPRCITPAAAWDIIRRLPPYVERIGVFVDWAPNAIAALADALRLSGVQLHGTESPDDVEDLSAKYSVVKALPVKQDFRPASIQQFRAARAILLERFHPELHGGTGEPWDWSRACEAGQYAKIVLAGGLAPENVAHAIRVARPYAVDVATRIERVVGKKDPQLVREFMRAIRLAEAEAASKHDGAPKSAAREAS
jgi:phosphoribosylanthranilate isomerase